MCLCRLLPYNLKYNSKRYCSTQFKSFKLWFAIHRSSLTLFIFFLACHGLLLFFFLSLIVYTIFIVRCCAQPYKRIFKFTLKNEMK